MRFFSNIVLYSHVKVSCRRNPVFELYLPSRLVSPRLARSGAACARKRMLRTFVFDVLYSFDVQLRLPSAAWWYSF